MKRFAIFLSSLSAFLIALSLTSCTHKTQPLSIEEEKAPVTVESLVILPTDISKPDTADKKTVGQLKTGASVLHSLIQERYGDKKGFLLLTDNQKEALIADFNGNTQMTACHIGRQLNADAVMLTSVSRYRERDGNDYSVNEPASVSFKYQLIHIPSGETLCLGVFDETQETLLSNLFSFSKASKRGFKWIKAEELTREGLTEKLKDCRYLNQ